MFQNGRNAYTLDTGYTGLPFGAAGALNTIASKGNTQRWANPCNAGLVTVRCSSVYGGYSESRVVDRPPAQNGYYCSLATTPDEWMALDLHKTLVIKGRVINHRY